MNEIFGMVDAIEAYILGCKRFPLTDKILMDERRLLEMLDKVRFALKSEGRIVRESLERAQGGASAPISESAQILSTDTVSAIPESEIAQRRAEAEQYAQQISAGADQYADQVLANMLFLVAKLQKNLQSMEKSIESGRQVLEKNKETHMPTGDANHAY